MWVIKLGGSLARAPELSLWLSALEDCAGEKLVLLPGGGVFADLVRDFSASHGLSEHCSHHMAIKAMEQYGLMLVDMSAVLCPVKHKEDLKAAWEVGRIPVLLPEHEVCDNPKIPANWSVTSDSIAAWLAAEIGASDLLLVKSLPPPRDSMPVESLVQSDIVDSAFQDFVTPETRYWWCGPESHQSLLSILKHLPISRFPAARILY